MSGPDIEPQPSRNRTTFPLSYAASMTTDLDGMKAGVQQTVDELFDEHLIPFTLSAREVESLGMEEYIVRFHNKQLRSLDVSWQKGQIFNTVFRTAILDRVSRLRTTQNLVTTTWQ